MNSIWTDFAGLIFRVEVQIEGPNGSDGMAPAGAPPWGAGGGGSSTRPAQVSYSGGGPVGSAEAIAMATAGAESAVGAYADGELDEHELMGTFVEQRVVDDEFAGVGRNDPCPCGSGKKFKKCHGA